MNQETINRAPKLKLSLNRSGFWDQVSGEYVTVTAQVKGFHPTRAIVPFKRDLLDVQKAKKILEEEYQHTLSQWYREAFPEVSL